MTTITYGSKDRPVQLDPFQTIYEVGWSGWDHAIVRFRYDMTAGGFGSLNQSPGEYDGHPLFFAYAQVENTLWKVGMLGPRFWLLEDWPTHKYGGGHNVLNGIAYYLRDEADFRDTENTYFNLKEIRKKYPDGCKVELHGMFYVSAQPNGNASVEMTLTTYRGGEVYDDVFDFGILGEPSRVVEITQTFTVPATISDTGRGMDGYEFKGESLLTTLNISSRGEVTLV
jgi:hypothetical protein